MATAFDPWASEPAVLPMATAFDPWAFEPAVLPMATVFGTRDPALVPIATHVAPSTLIFPLFRTTLLIVEFVPGAPILPFCRVTPPTKLCPEIVPVLIIPAVTFPSASVTPPIVFTTDGVGVKIPPDEIETPPTSESVRDTPPIKLGLADGFTMAPQTVSWVTASERFRALMTMSFSAPLAGWAETMRATPFVLSYPSPRAAPVVLVMSGPKSA